MAAVCSLAISVATRYSSPETVPTSTVKTSRAHSLQEQGRQRLTKDATNWMPPVIVSIVLHQPAPQRRVASDGPVVSRLVFASSLYYRPPPVV